MRKRNLAVLRRLTFCSLLVACGSRTGLFGDADSVGGINGPGPGPGRVDGSADGNINVRPDGAPIDRPDALPILDVQPPIDVYRADCPDADALLVYTITDTYDLQSFNPDTGQFRFITKISCPTAGDATPFSMGVDRKGIAYILFSDEKIYRVSTATGACIATAYEPRQQNFARFGMGFATTGAGPTETLYIAGDESNVGPGRPPGARGFAAIDPKTFKLARIGDDPRFDSAELTGTGDGRLYAFYRGFDDDKESNIGEVDVNTGIIVGERHFTEVAQGRGWAFAFWGGDFYMFHSPDGQTRVTRWRPSDDSVQTIATTSLNIVGAGVSTCAPQQ